MAAVIPNPTLTRFGLSAILIEKHCFDRFSQVLERLRKKTDGPKRASRYRTCEKSPERHRMKKNASFIGWIISIGIAMSAALPAFAQDGRDANGLGQTRNALVIGNAAYRTARLDNPVNDAAAMERVLKGLDFDVICLRDSAAKDMERAIRDFGRQIRKGGVALFYYAGHGVQLDGVNYLVPVDAEIVEEMEIKYEAVDANRILDMMYDADTLINIVILDACRNNPFKDRSYRGAVRERGLARMDAPRGTIIAYSTSPGEVADDGAGENSVYTKHLKEFLPKPGLTVEQVFKKVRNAVVGETGNKQVPWESTSLTGDDFCFVSCTKSRERIVWQAKLEDMKRNFEHVVSCDDENIEMKRGLLSVFLQTYGEDNPYTDEDDSMRATAQGLLDLLARQPSLRTEEETSFGCLSVVNVEKWDVLNIRELPDHKSRIVGEIPCDGKNIVDLKQTYYSGKSRWKKIQYGDYAGWVNGAYLQIDVKCGRGQAAAPPREKAAEDRPVRTCFSVVNVESWDVLNIRETPYYKSRKVGEIPHDATNVLYMGRKQTFANGSVWVEISYENQTGWVNGRFLKNAVCP